MMRATILMAIAVAAVLLGCAAAADNKVQVYILMGQSNMLGEGKIEPPGTNGSLEYAVHTEKKYQYLVNSTGDWTVRDDVRYTFIMGSGNQSFESSKMEHNEWMTVTGKTIGPELGIGHYMGNYTNGKVLILKACIGDRALGWDLLPPGSPGYEFTDSKNVTYEYAAYHQSPEKWVKGTTPTPIGWMAGEQYDGDTNRTAIVLSNLTNYYPGESEYEIAGFFWWQGNRDSFDTGLSTHYEENLVRLIKTLRKQFDAPNAKFVTASLGETAMNSTDNGGLILKAMLDVDGKSGKYPEFKGNVAAVYTHPLSMGGSSGAHYNGNAETYMNVGQAMGDAMIGLLKEDELNQNHKN